MISEKRFIHSRLSTRHIPDLLQAIFVAELISPSRDIWIISPWISDIPVIDNQTNRFQHLGTDWTQSRIRLSQVLAKMTDQGTNIYLGTRPDPINRPFLNRLTQKANPTLLTIQYANELHEKGILGDTFYLAGSMNFTFNGITLNEEAVTFETGQAVVSEHRLIFQKRWAKKS